MNKDHRLKKWIALYTKPRHEKIVLRELKKKGFQTYLPLLKERRKWSDRKRWVEFPMFKSYIFVKTELKESIFIIQTSGVVKIIKFGNKIATIQNSIIDSLKLMIEGGYSPESTDYFIKGDLAEVVDGPLKGVVGAVARIDGKDRLIIRIDCIQHSVSIQIKRNFLKRIN